MSGRGVPPSVAVLRTDRDALQGLEGSNLRIHPRTSAGATRAAVGRPPRPDRQRLSSCWIRLVWWWTEADDHEGCSLWPSRLPPCQRPRPKVSPVRMVHRVAVVHPQGSERTVGSSLTVLVGTQPFWAAKALWASPPTVPVAVRKTPARRARTCELALPARR